MDDKVPPIGSKESPLPSVLEMGHLWRYNGSTYCFRPDCKDCKYDPTCQREDVIIKVGPGLNIRRAFKALPGFRLVAIDYSGIELRIAAQLSGEPSLMRPFLQGRDPHQEMAKICFKTDSPTKDQRRQAKCCNYGNLYMGSVWTLVRQSDLTATQAHFIWNAWWTNVPEYKRWVESQFEFAKHYKYITTFFGRRRDLSEMVAKAEEMALSGKKDHKSGWDFIKRTTANTPIQGTSADVIKIAMCKVHEFLTKEKLHDEVKMHLTVHDELVLSIKDGPGFFDLCKEVRRQMTPDLSPWGWKVPLETDCEIGDNWAEMVKIEDLLPKSETTVSELESKPIFRDTITVNVNTQLSEANRIHLHLALLQAATGQDFSSDVFSVRVPVKLRIAGKVYRPSGPGGERLKVNEFLLQKLVRDIPGVEILDESPVSNSSTVDGTIQG
jgi:hypothetical protein